MGRKGLTGIAEGRRSAAEGTELFLGSPLEAVEKCFRFSIRRNGAAIVVMMDNEGGNQDIFQPDEL